MSSQRQSPFIAARGDRALWSATFLLRELFLVTVMLAALLATGFGPDRYAFAAAIAAVALPYDLALAWLTRRRRQVPLALAFGDQLMAAGLAALFPVVMPAALVAAVASLGLTCVAFSRRVAVTTTTVGVAAFSAAVGWWALTDVDLPSSAFIALPGYAVAATAMMVAITALSQREARTRAWFADLVANLDVIVWEYDPVARRMGYISERVETLLGFAADEWRRRTDLRDQQLHPDDRSRVRAALGEAIRHATPYDMTYRAMTASGQVIWVREMVTCERGQDGRATVVRGSIVDVTRHQELLEALEEGNRRQRMLAELGRDALVEPDLDRLLRGAAQATARVLRAPCAIWEVDEHGLSRRATGAWPPSDIGVIRIPVAGPHGEALHARGQIVDGPAEPAGPPGNASASVVAVQGIEGAWGVMAVYAGSSLADDDRVTLQSAATLLANAVQREAVETQLRQAQKMDAVGQLAGGIAQDFSDLLTAMLGQVDIVAHDVRHPSARDAVDQIRDAVQHAGGLTAQLMAFSRGRASHAPNVDVNDIVRGVQGLLQPLVGQRIQIDSALKGDVRPVHAGAHELEQILVNLVGNARDALPGGGTVRIETVAAHIDERAASALGIPVGAYVQLSVRDDGTDLDDASRRRMHRLVSGTGAALDAYATGLGAAAATVRGIGGAIAVDSPPGAGTTVHVWLPVEGLEVASAEASADGARVLVIEDQATVRSLLREVLEQAGYEVRAAQHGQEALARAEAGDPPPDLIIVDVVLPDTNGVEVARRLRQRWPRVRVVYMSGFSGPPKPPDEADGFLHKPFGVNTLLSCVAEALQTTKHPG